MPVTISASGPSVGSVSAFFGPSRNNQPNPFTVFENSENVTISTSDNGTDANQETSIDPSRFQFDDPLKSITELQEEENKNQIEAILGSRIEELTDENRDRRGGTFGSVSGGSITLTNQDDESLTIDTDEPLRFFKNSEGSVTVENLESEESITVSPENNLTVEGEGNLDVSSQEGSVRFNAGDEINLQTENNTVTLSNQESVESVSLGNLNEITVTNNGNDTTEQLSLISGSGGSITFSEGDSGTIRRNQDGSLTIVNETTGETSQFSSGDSITVGGAAEGQLRSGSTNATVELSEGTQLTPQSPTDDGDQSLTINSSLQSVKIRSLEEGPQAERPLQIRTFQDPGLLSQQAVSEGLLGQASSNESTNSNKESSTTNQLLSTGQSSNSAESSGETVNLATRQPVSQQKNQSPLTEKIPGLEANVRRSPTSPQRNENVFIQNDEDEETPLNQFLRNIQSRSNASRPGFNQIQNQTFPFNQFPSEASIGNGFPIGRTINSLI